MFETIIAILLVIIFMTTSNKVVKNIAGSLFAGGIGFYISGFTIMAGCGMFDGLGYGVLGYRFCGEITGLANIIASAAVTGLLTTIIIYTILHQRKL